jgi:hypothetical protein
MNHSPCPSFGAEIAIPSETFGGVIRPRVRRASRLVERETSATNPVLLSALQLGVVAVAAAGTIFLALFAWSGAGL